jgi:DNA-directed RNA polymerase subunit B"
MVSKEKDGTLITSKVFSMRHGFRARCVVERNLEGVMNVSFPAAPKDLRITTVLRALGLESTDEIKAAFRGAKDDEALMNDILLNLEIDETHNREEASEAMGKKVAPGQAKEYRAKRVDVLLDTYLLPHLGTEPADRLGKAYYICKMAEKAMKVGYGLIPEDDKDFYGNKRIKLAGNLMEELFRYAFQFLVKDVAYQVERAFARGRRLVVQTIVRPDALSERVRYSMATGNWIAGQTGVSQLLDRTNHLAAVSHLRRIMSPLSRKHPHFKARDLHGSQWGKLCPNESPEGPSCALVKNMALMCEITTGAGEKPLEDLLRAAGVAIDGVPIAAARGVERGEAPSVEVKVEAKAEVKKESGHQGGKK